jgi:hypothetical protein
MEELVVQVALLAVELAVTAATLVKMVIYLDMLTLVILVLHQIHLVLAVVVVVQVDQSLFLKVNHLLALVVVEELGIKEGYWFTQYDKSFRRS